MNLLNIIEEIEKTDPEVYERLDGRRAAMKKFFSFSGKVGAAAIPVAFGTMLTKAYGQTTPPSIVEVLNFALTLEYLEAEFYVTGLGSGVIPSTDRPAFETISDHENDHVVFLQNALGSAAVPKPTFDFSAGNTFIPGNGNNSMTGPFADVFSNYATFLAVSQTFEDTGVRAYKGQAANLISSNEVLRAALRIHSVEARHASHVREIRRRNGLFVPSGVLLQPWITSDQSGIVSSAVQASYNGEELTTQAGINIVGINGFAIDSQDASEAFDEPLNMRQILDIVDPFIV